MASLPASAALAFLPALALAVGGVGVAPRVTDAAAGARSLVLLPAAALRSIRWTGQVAAGTPVRLGLVLDAAHPAALRAYALAAATPGSPLYHHFLSAQAVERRFGPAPAVVERDSRALTVMGFRAIRRQGAILYARAPAAVVAAALRTSLRVGLVDGEAVMAPAGSVRVPAALSDVAWVTGLVRPVPAGGPLRRAADAVAHATRPVPLLSSEASGAGTSLVGGYAAVSAVVGPASVPTGLPVTIRTTITTPTATGDALAVIGDYVIDQGPADQAASQVEVDGPDNAGDVATTFTAYTPGTYQLAVRVRPAIGQPLQTVVLPAVTFTGSAAAAGPFGAAQMTAAMGATSVVAESTARPASVALFATTQPDLADLDAFAHANGLVAPTVTTVAVDGGAQPGASDGGELSLDLESVATASPGATVFVYDAPADSTAPGGTFVDVMNAVAAADNVSVLSMSYAQAETTGSGGKALEQAVESLNAEGITVVSGAGDNGAFGVVDAGVTAPGVAASPADTPEVTAVGGVDVRLNAQGGGGLATSYWGGETYAALSASYLRHVLAGPNGKGNVLGGGGYSGVFRAPAWQAGLVAAAPGGGGGGGGGRGVPDLAMPASADYPGLSVVLQGQATVGGGTSMAAPLFAGYLADIAASTGAGFGDVNIDLYQAAAADPSLMTRALYGYDGRWQISPAAWNPLTGLGTPNIDRLAQDLATIGRPALEALTAAPVTPVALAPGEALTVAFTATGTAGAPVADVALHLAVTGSLPASGLSSTAIVTNASGRASAQFSDATGSASGTIVATAPSGVTASTAVVTVTRAPVRALAFAAASGSSVAGHMARLAMVETVTPAGARPGPVAVWVRIGGPRSRTFRATLAPGGGVTVRLVKTGRYAIDVALAATPGVQARRHIRVLPGAPVRFVFRAGARVRATAPLRSQLTAYDAFGNVDTSVTGRVRFVWQAASRTYRTLAAFRNGEATGVFRPPVGIRGAVDASYAVLSAVNPPIAPTAPS